MAAAASAKQPHIHEAMHAILGELGVAKNGVLPGNMGGKPYITASDVAKEVKALLVKNDAFVLPVETVNKHEIIQSNNRLQVAVVIEGQYTFVSTKDGSSVTVQGVGDGLATGTAVASNIASTNALKNAMLRTFMITEQSVEDAAKNGVPDEDAPAPRAVQAATKGATTKAAPKGDNIQAKQTAVREAWEAINGEGDTGYVQLGNKVTGKSPAEWATSSSDLDALLKAIHDGEVV